MATPAVYPASTTAAVSCPVVEQLRSLTFTCTFCWHISSTSPRVVGRSARLACELCYNALLDLSICWVCGEIVVRGDDCVSLGWCFWHKSCYGCLICGNRIVAHGATVRDVFMDEVDHENVRDGHPLKAARSQAKEIDEIPLCAHCYVEVGADEMNSRNVVNGALRRMDYRDGGLTRHKHENGHHIPADVTRSERQAELANGICPVPLDSTIYVSIRDPTASAFKPSPTKPIPRWTAATPVQRDDASDHERQHEPALGNELRYGSQAEMSSQRRHSSYTTSTDHTERPTTPTREPVSPVMPPIPTPPTVSTALANTQPTPVSPISIPNTFRYSRAGFIDSESLKRPSSRLDRIREEESSHVESRTPTPYMTPPEWPVFLCCDERSSPDPLLGRQSHAVTALDAGATDNILSAMSSQRLTSLISPTQTPKSSRLPRLSTASEPVEIPQRSRLPKRSTMLRAKIAAHQGHAGHPAIPMSSEFLERYGLVKGRDTPSPSALLKKTPPSSRRSSHEPQPILARLTKNSRSGPTTGLVDETTVVTATDRSSTPTQFSLDSTTGSIGVHDGPGLDREQVSRRRSLQAELQRLFRGQ
ncbi:hypothetical protein BR93DRAFT_254890 [Coniochaeta sp. PMI_546]|nr:hypothetical protein BR93DRAFT_254890 [Coniochaeta sp. PMI_546]